MIGISWASLRSPRFGRSFGSRARSGRASISPARRVRPAGTSAQALFTPRLPALRGLLQPGRDRAHDRAHAGHPPAASGMESLERRERALAAQDLPPSYGRCGSLRPCRGRDGLHLALCIRVRWRLRRRSWRCGSPRPASPGGSAGRCLRGEARLDGRPEWLSCGSSRARPGRFSRTSSARKTLVAARQRAGASGAVVAHRTSPTNMGLALLANLAAHDFGYLSTGQLIERTHERVPARWQPMERYRGHFYNWYDTRTLSRCRRSTSRRWTAAICRALVDLAAGVARAYGRSGSAARVARRVRRHAGVLVDVAAIGTAPARLAQLRKGARRRRAIPGHAARRRGQCLERLATLPRRPRPASMRIPRTPRARRAGRRPSSGSVRTSLTISASRAVGRCRRCPKDVGDFPARRHPDAARDRGARRRGLPAIEHVRRRRSTPAERDWLDDACNAGGAR